MTSRSSAMLMAAVAGMLWSAPAQAQTLPEGNGKELVQTVCRQCHGLGEIFQSGYQGDDWKRIVPLMVGYGAALTGDQMPVVIDYLAKNIVPTPKPEPALVPGTVEAHITEWRLPEAGAWPHDAYVTRDGMVWYSAQNTNKLGRFDPKTQQFKEFDLKTPKSGPQSMVDDAEGNIWFTPADAKYIGKLDPKTGAITEYPLPDPTASHPHTPVLDGKGNIWMTVSGKSHLAKLVIRTGEIKMVSTKTPNANPYGIAVNSQGVPFVTLFNTNKLASVDPATMEVREYTLPNPETRPRRIAITPDDMVWYTDYARGYLGRLNPKTGEVKEWRSPSGDKSAPYGISVIKGVIWYSESEASPNTVVRFDPKSEKFQSWAIPGGGNIVRNTSATRDGGFVLANSLTNEVTLVRVAK